MEIDDIVDKYIGEFRTCGYLSAGDVMTHLGEAVNNYED